MKVTAKTSEQECKPKYPYYGIHATGSVVFFTGKKTGYIIACSDYQFGEIRTDWTEDSFTPFYGTITIEKD